MTNPQKLSSGVPRSALLLLPFCFAFASPRADLRRAFWPRPLAHQGAPSLPASTPILNPYFREPLHGSFSDGRISSFSVGRSSAEDEFDERRLIGNLSPRSTKYIIVYRGLPAMPRGRSRPPRSAVVAALLVPSLGVLRYQWRLSTQRVPLELRGAAHLEVSWF